MNFSPNYAPYIKGEQTKRPIIAILVKEDSNEKHAVVLVSAKGKVDLQTMKASEFAKQFMGVSNGDDHRPDRYIEEWLAVPKMKFSEDAIKHIERILNMDTRGKTSAQIREEIARIAVELPEGNSLRNVPAAYADRGAAIAAYTAVRQELFKLGKQESTMAKAKDASKTAAPAAAEKAAPAKPAKATRDAKAVAKKAGEKAANGRKKADFAGTYVLSEKESSEVKGVVASKVKDPSELRLQKGSARHKLMTFMIKKKKATYEQIKAELGDQADQALSGMTRYGFLVKSA